MLIVPVGHLATLEGLRTDHMPSASLRSSLSQHSASPPAPAPFTWTMSHLPTSPEQFKHAPVRVPSHHKSSNSIGAPPSRSGPSPAPRVPSAIYYEHGPSTLPPPTTLKYTKDVHTARWEQSVAAQHDELEEQRRYFRPLQQQQQQTRLPTARLQPLPSRYPAYTPHLRQGYPALGEEGRLPELEYTDSDYPSPTTPLSDVDTTYHFHTTIQRSSSVYSAPLSQNPFLHQNLVPQHQFSIPPQPAPDQCGNYPDRLPGARTGYYPGRG